MKSSTAEGKIISIAEEIGVDPQLALAVARCESDLRPGIKNKNSSASGIFQFLNSTWRSTLIRMGVPLNLDVFDESSNIMAGLWLMKKDGVNTHWYPSKECWSNYEAS